LQGSDTDHKAPSTRFQPIEKLLISARLRTLVHLARISARLTYGRLTGLGEFDWRVLDRIGERNPITISELALRFALDKAQVSRAVRRLRELELVRQQRARGAVGLTPKGQQLFGHMQKVALARNSMFTAGLNTTEQTLFLDILTRVYLNSEALLDDERSDGEERRRARAAWEVDEIRRWSRAGPIDSLIIPRLLGVSRSMLRSMVPAYKRLTGLSDVEWTLLTWIAHHQPLQLTGLVQMAERHKAHVGRVVRALADQQLIERHKTPGKREIRLTTTPKGEDLYRKLEKEALRRNAIYLAGVTAEEQQRFQAILDKLTENAESMAAYEQAVITTTSRYRRSEQAERENDPSDSA